MCAIASGVWTQTHAVVVEVDNHSGIMLTNVVVLVTGKTYKLGNVAPYKHRTVIVWPASDNKIQLRDSYMGRELEHVNLGMPSMLETHSTTDLLGGGAFRDFATHRILHGSIF